MKRHIVLTALAVRICIALLTQTFFQPDEYFQSLEVAHQLVFSYGHLTWEWLSPEPIRSILYPGLNAPIYYALKILHLDGTELLVGEYALTSLCICFIHILNQIWGPKILHGALASLTDIWLCILTERVIGERYVSIVLLLSLASLFHGLALSRSLSNSAETSLTTVALSYFPWDTQSSSWKRSFRLSLSIAAVACAVRPTNAVLWVYMVTLLAWECRRDIKDILYLAINVALIGSLALTTLCALDSLYYGKLTIAPLNFARTNLSSVSLFYGTSPWHYYLSQGLLVLATIVLPFSLHGMLLSVGAGGTPASKSLVGLVLWTITVYSLAGHKEWRFIHPLLPILHLFATRSIVDVYYRKLAKKTATKKRHSRSSKLPISRAHFLLILLNIPPLIYLMLFHGRAQIDVILYLRSLPDDAVSSVGFLMPCHSTPWQAYLHKPTWSDDQRLWALGCEPPLGGEITKDYKDQADVFYDSPMAYLRTRFPPSVDHSFPPSPHPSSRPGEPRERRDVHDWMHEWPEYLVMFGVLLREPGVVDLLKEKGYVPVWHENYGWEGDRRRRGGVLVMKVA
ncbi:glycosyltransferase family 22 protein [Phanerochaete carnosa HHB-10118-sp]|uniref:Mannosyltransferase n=1 Tax=Phanerochaete carnosa (strain HHB-10118-sp) TaxID=650164 RepID=K5VUE4_PHACS|nr:glycosyltransferase family 22 protein [Phanerochaete carnosa HHB-10118-sp]EKM55153.1 glycosyltransferase family 22 protein [Phanerochaete carnosa HHB-10118-sp]